MTNLDPEEERLITEAMLETAGEDLYGEALEFGEGTPKGNGDDNVPKSKVQFPFRKRNSSRNRKIFCIATFLVVVFGALVAAYFILRTKTFSFELKIQKGHVLHYKLTQESGYEGIHQARSSFTEDVFVQVVNKTGSRCWMEVSMKSMPKSMAQRTFLVSVDLRSKNSINMEGERSLKVFTCNNSNSRSLEYYTWNLVMQLFPVVKIDLFEVILSQITTRKHELTLQDSKFFPGKITMKQNIRMSKEHVLVTSRVDPEGFASFGSSKSKRLPDVSFTFEEDTAISKSTGMIETSHMELFAEIPLHGDLHEKTGKTLVMRFKSSFSLVKEESSIVYQNKLENAHLLVEMLELSTQPKPALEYFSPSYKEYNEGSNVVDRVKELLNMTRLHDSGGNSYQRNKDLEEFAKSFHKIEKPGFETNFAEVEENGEKRDSLPLRKINIHRAGDEPFGSQDDVDSDDDDENTYSDRYDAPSDEDDDEDDGDGREDDHDHTRRWNQLGQAVPSNPDNKNDADADSYREHVGHTGEDLQSNSSRFLHKHRNANTTKKSHSPRKRYRYEHKETNTDRFSGGNQASKKQSLKKVNQTSVKSNQVTTHQKGNLDNEAKMNKADKTAGPEGAALKTPASQHEQSFFNRMFDEIWNDDDNPVEEGDDDKHGFQFTNLVPFSFSSNFPFVHFRWPHFDSRKRRSLEPNEQVKVGGDVITRDKHDVAHSNKHDVIPQNKSDVIYRFKRDVIHRDKRRLYNDDHFDDDDDYTSRDLESVMDVISPGSIKEHPMETSQIFNQKIMGLSINGELEHEVKVLTGSSRDNWVINLSLLLSVNEHKFKVLHKRISMKEIEERFVKNSKPKYEHGTVHAGSLVLCTRFHYMENICVKLQLGFVVHISHTIDNLFKEYPVELSVFFKHLSKVDVTLSSHMTSLLGSHGVYGQGPVFGAKIPLKVKFSEVKNMAQWCSVANLKLKVGHFYESWKDFSQWSCPIDKAVKKGAICKGLNKNSTHKSPSRLWYNRVSTKKLHFLNTC